MSPSEACVVMLRLFEACKLEAYQDQHGVWTCGYGSTGPDIVEGTVWTQEVADARFEAGVAEHAKQVAALIKVPVTQGQFDALVSFVYNIGSGNFSSSTVLKELNAGNTMAAADHMLDWCKVAGQYNRGLFNRRRVEREHFLVATA
jgi:lysozyme